MSVGVMPAASSVRTAATREAGPSGAGRVMGPSAPRFEPCSDSRPTISTASRPVRYSSTAANWPASPMRLRTATGSRTTSMPATVAVPPSGRSSVARTRISVVLPAPFGPSRA